MKNLKGKVAIVTGSSSGVGAATALQLAGLGCHVVVNYHSNSCLLYTSPSPRDATLSRMPSSA